MLFCDTTRKGTEQIHWCTYYPPEQSSSSDFSQIVQLNMYLVEFKVLQPHDYRQDIWH